MKTSGAAWTLLVIAALLELVWALALKQSEGFTRLWPSVLGVTVALTSFVLLSFAITSLPVGTAYAVWVGIGAAGVYVAGVAAFGEELTWARAGCVLLILGGVAGLKLTED
ncbi:multidrug efflux SMR transporter [Streptomyces sp. N2-109]|uniref:Multidrug efflux SMR transporter n=1 Tax=Streptomyces gossypii TaxID=2883101 RepID=A0ABT2JRE9_9ACTN|nr:multidrug efflux SMR transporter [Streptomyces gossypii]MCT2590401.1 multidrug efflux SMR transporter [Streptomyces gossypii]